MTNASAAAPLTDDEIAAIRANLDEYLLAKDKLPGFVHLEMYVSPEEVGALLLKIEDDRLDRSFRDEVDRSYFD